MIFYRLLDKYFSLVVLISLRNERFVISQARAPKTTKRIFFISFYLKTLAQITNKRFMNSIYFNGIG